MLKWRVLCFTLSMLSACPMARAGVAEPVKLASGDFLPYIARESAGGGMLTEVVRGAFKRVGRTTTLDWMPWKRGYELTRIGQFDATFPYARKPDREQAFFYSDWLYGGVRSVYARPGSGIDPTNLDSFRGKRYCVPNG
ncbi:MAG TPA: amino acid ABC transporter substrate-binding protein, partial [Oxalobacteraceae bacterium]|nr:amino acid ABC transporter substrate-binding protein [Oxalobacteraceae bacterium]